MDAVNAIKGNAAFLSLLKDEGVSHVFGNPGTTELPLMDALGKQDDIPYVLGLQESIVISMADGFGRASGKLSACNVHVAPGLGNAMGAIYNAKFTGTPMIITAGQHETSTVLTEPVLSGPLVAMAEPLVKWAIEINRLEDLPRVVRRAAKIATTAPTGPVFLSLPGDVLTDEAGIDLGASTRVDTRVRPNDKAIDGLVTRLLAAKNPAMIAGVEVVSSDALDEAGKLAEVLGAPTYQSTVAYNAQFLSENPAHMGALSRVQRDIRRTLEPYDVLIFLGADVLRTSVASPIDPMPPGASVIQIGLRDWEAGKNYAAEIALHADVKETLHALLPILEIKGGKKLKSTAAKRLAIIEKTNWKAKYPKVRESALARSGDSPIAPEWLTVNLVEAMPDETIIVNEALTSMRVLTSLRPHRDRWCYHGNASGGIGWGLPGSIGVQMAHPNRKVVCISGDGSALYSIQALWTAANMNLPITFVITNNKGYRILKQRITAFHGSENYLGMEFDEPEIDFAGIAQSFGVMSKKIEDPTALRAAIDVAMNHKGPYLLDVLVDGSVG